MLPGLCLLTRQIITGRLKGIDSGFPETQTAAESPVLSTAVQSSFQHLSPTPLPFHPPRPHAAGLTSPPAAGVPPCGSPCDCDCPDADPCVGPAVGEVAGPDPEATGPGFPSTVLALIHSPRSFGSFL